MGCTAGMKQKGARRVGDDRMAAVIGNTLGELRVAPFRATSLSRGVAERARRIRYGGQRLHCLTDYME